MLPAFDDRHGPSGPQKVQCGRESGQAGADDDHVVGPSWNGTRVVRARLHGLSPLSGAVRDADSVPVSRAGSLSGAGRFQPAYRICQVTRVIAP
ncbi:hypothetical protein GCM10009799_35620 [Nocardiopsis rhodophaea]|uniref:Uncharacterized protein n=1 Tax=Nocardiopsis rhodophaea TaxID=280238 RepID=A0ABP5EQM4_9ACTN